MCTHFACNIDLDGSALAIWLVSACRSKALRTDATASSDGLGQNARRVGAESVDSTTVLEGDVTSFAGASRSRGRKLDGGIEYAQGTVAPDSAAPAHALSQYAVGS